MRKHFGGFMRYFGLALAFLYCTSCVIHTTLVADTVGVKGDVNTNANIGVQPTAISSGLGVQGVELSRTSMIIGVNKSAKLTATVRYVDGSSDSNVSFSASDANIVAVNAATGEISGLRPGNVAVLATSRSDTNRFAVVQVSVREGDFEDVFAAISPARVNVAVRQSVQLVADVQDGSGKTHNYGWWTSSNPNVAFVNSKGIVTGVQDGVVTITFTSGLNLKSELRATAEVTVGGATVAKPIPPPTIPGFGYPTPTPTPVMPPPQPIYLGGVPLPPPGFGYPTPAPTPVMPTPPPVTVPPHNAPEPPRLDASTVDSTIISSVPVTTETSTSDIPLSNK